MKNSDPMRSLNKLVASVIVDRESSEILLDPKRRRAILENPDLELNFSDEERELLMGIKAEDTAEFFRQAYEGYQQIHPVTSKESKNLQNLLRETYARILGPHTPSKERC